MSGDNAQAQGPRQHSAAAAAFGLGMAESFGGTRRLFAGGRRVIRVGGLPR
jgi:hypothetical protein